MALAAVGACGYVPDLAASQERAQAVGAEIGSVGCVGQVLSPGPRGVAAVDVLVDPAPGWREPVRMVVWADDAPDPARVAWAPPRPSGESTYARFVFEPVAAGELTFCLDAARPAGVRAWHAEDLSRPGEPRFEDGRAVPGALAFRAYYRADPLVAVGDAAAAASRWPGGLAAGLLLLIGIGLAAAPALGDRRADVVLAAAPGLGLLGLTLGWWLADLAGAPVHPAAAAAAGLAGLALAARAARTGRWCGWGDAGWLGLVWLATLVARLANVRDLALPPWVDGVHHAYLTDLLIRHMGVPDDFGPLLGFGPFTYHFGFHAYAATTALLSGTAAADAVLLAGQLLGAAAAPSAYLLTRLYGGSPRAGLAAAGIAGLVSVMPSYFLSWSRFTQLGGLVAGPVWLLLARRAPSSRVAAVLAGAASAALLLLHPRVAVLAGLLLAADWLVRARRRPASGWRLAGRRLLLAGAVALGLALPWLVPLAGSLVPRLGAGGAAALEANRLDMALLQSGYDPYVYGLAAAALAGGLLGGAAGPTVAALWLAAALVAANPAWLGLPGSYMVSSGALLISLWLPAAALGGGLVARAGEVAAGRLGGPVGRLAAAGSAPALVALAVGLGAQALTPLNPATVLATAADRRALEAAARLLPPDAVVAVSAREWQLETYMGADAGYWIGVLTPGRAVVPPLLYGLGPPEQARAVSARLARWEAVGGVGELVRLMGEVGAGWVFVGERGGAIDRRWLTSAAGFEPVVVERGAALYRWRGG